MSIKPPGSRHCAWQKVVWFVVKPERNRNPSFECRVVHECRILWLDYRIVREMTWLKSLVIRIKGNGMLGKKKERKGKRHRQTNEKGRGEKPACGGISILVAWCLIFIRRGRALQKCAFENLPSLFLSLYHHFSAPIFSFCLQCLVNQLQQRHQQHLLDQRHLSQEVLALEVPTMLPQPLRCSARQAPLLRLPCLARQVLLLHHLCLARQALQPHLHLVRPLCHNPSNNQAHSVQTQLLEDQANPMQALQVSQRHHLSLAPTELHQLTPLEERTVCLAIVPSMPLPTVVR